MSVLDSVLDTSQQLVTYVARTVAATLLSPSSDLSLGSLLVALAMAAAWLARRHLARGLPIRAAALGRMLFPRSWWWSASSRLDVRLLLLNLLVFSVILGGAVLSHRLFSDGVGTLLLGALGPPRPLGLPDFAGAAILTVALFVAYELAYWIYHYLSHTVPALWELHKVHHSAEVLTPLTNSRVHPLEGALFLNMIAVFLGTTDGVVTYLLGAPVHPFTIAGGNLLVVLGTYLIAHLHHTHVWIAFTGVWGRILISPAHHQIHHSTNPIHFNKNMGSVLAVWDWLFGTLHIPETTRERLTFGIGDGEVTEHTVAQELLRPVHALAALAGGAGRGQSTAAPVAMAGDQLAAKP